MTEAKQLTTSELYKLNRLDEIKATVYVSFSQQFDSTVEIYDIICDDIYSTVDTVEEMIENARANKLVVSKRTDVSFGDLFTIKCAFDNQDTDQEQILEFLRKSNLIYF